jgi:hypothetical protein
MIHRARAVPAALLSSVRLLLVAAVFAAPVAAEDIPYFARKYGLTCAACHASPPKLNEFGERFIAAGYSDPDLVATPTWPLSVWISARTESLPSTGPLRGEVVTYLNRIEVISGGRLVAPWLTYFVEWRPLSLETRSDGTTRDRSGRFEDLFVTAEAGPIDVTIGQFRLLQQVDVSRRIGLSEPLVFAASLAGEAGGTPRQVSLRSFSPAGRSPAVRLAWSRPAARGAWTTSVALPVPGELTIPLTGEARTEASNEIEGEPKGVFLESFYRRGLLSAGAHAFYENGDRYLATGVVTGRRGVWHGAAALGFDHTADQTRARWSLEGEYIPRPDLAFGSRLEDRTDDGAGLAFLPYVNLHYPGTRYTARLTVEVRFQRDRQATFFELGAVF